MALRFKSIDYVFNDYIGECRLLTFCIPIKKLSVIKVETCWKATLSRSLMIAL